MEKMENVRELALAEMAAFGGGGGFSGDGQPQVVYRTFFKKHPDLFAGWQQTAPAAILYAHWGPNPLNPSSSGSKPSFPSGQPTIHDVLAAGHRPFATLVDASLPDRADELARFAVIYIESHAYEMSPDQLRALHDYASRGRIILADKNATINGRPIVKLLGSDRVTIWDPNQPTMPTDAVAPVEGIRRNVRFALYEQPNRLAIHAVNYNVCLLDPKQKVLEVEATPLSIPLSAGWKDASATCFDPGAAPETLPCTVTEGIARLTLPKLHIYKVVLLERR